MVIFSLVNNITDSVALTLTQPADNAIVDFEFFKNVVIWSGIIGIGVAIILCIISFLLSKIKISSGFLKFAFIISWLFAFALYDIGMCIDDTFINLLWNAPMAMIHAFGTFLLSSDVSEIHSTLFEDSRFMALFSISHALSAFVSALFIIKVFGFNVIQKIKLLFEVIKPSRCKETYVIWGCNSASYKMVESINEHLKNNKKDYRIIIIKTAENDEDSSDSDLGFNRIFELLSLNRDDLEQLQNLGCFIASSSRTDIASLNSNLNCVDNEYEDIIRQQLQLKSLAYLLNPKKTTHTIHFLFLSDDEKQNLHDVSVLLGDATLNAFATSAKTGNSDESFQFVPRKVIFYCHARFNGVHRVIEDRHFSNNLEVRVIDSSHINVEMLKRNPDVLPVNFVDVDHDASVSSSFNAMIIGFSEVGQDVARFLYEFGAFVRSGGDAEHAERSEFHLDVIDNNMKDKAGLFVANSPAIKPSVPFVAGMENPDALIELHNLDCNSIEFYAKLQEKIKMLNYVVLSTDNDELNMSMAVRIFRTALRNRANLANFCILIRIHNDDDGHFLKIAQYYNRLWAAQDPMDIVGKKPNNKIKSSDICKFPLYIFGNDEDVYTYSNIIDNFVVRKAISHKEKYTASTEDNYKIPENEFDRRWYKDIEDLLQTNDEFHPSYARLMRLRRTQGQDIANSLHCLTKELLMDKALNLNNIQRFNWSSLQRFNSTMKYSAINGEEVNPIIFRILEVLAQTEHLRWNASHEILGYVFDSKGKDEIRLRHNCLTKWENLDEETRSYDSNVVDITFGIIDPNNKIKRYELHPSPHGHS